jgi:predicted Abi (CAAX) family protease
MRHFWYRISVDLEFICYILFHFLNALDALFVSGVFGQAFFEKGCGQAFF